MLILWLDDRRNPNEHGAIGALWAKTYEDAIQYLETGKITIASLDHDLTLSQTLGFTDGSYTGYDLLLWMQEHDVWPEKVYVHSENKKGRRRMLDIIQKHYGTTFEWA
jgi:hypothetical protein